ncbi:hypothetical protein QBC45DRAFT_154220 [Copromyces sp. CBS 386.78]|nr:hypothetical protein QBC45DRAFT_154220 [Copromyces sp. CBS 386.78]
MAFQTPTDHSGPFSHLSSFDNPLPGSAEPCDDSFPDLLGDSFQFPLDAFWLDFSLDGINFDHSLNSLVLGPTHQASLSTPIPVPAPAPAPRLCSPSTQAYPKAHDTVSDQAPDYHASPNAGLASSSCGTIGPPRAIGVNAYSGLPQGLSGSGRDHGFHTGPSGYQQPTSESHHRVRDWSLVANPPISNLNNATLAQHQNLHGACHPSLSLLSSNINNAPALAEAVLTSQLWQPVGAPGHGSWTDDGIGSLLIQEYFDGSTDTENQWPSPQQDICDRVTPFCEGHGGHGVDCESTGFDHSVGVQSPFDGGGSLMPHSTSRTPELRDDPQTPSLSTNVTTPESTGNSGPSTPEPSLLESRRKSQPAIFQFVQYTAGSNTGDRTSKKRLTYGDNYQDASANIVTKDILRDQEGTVQGIQIVFHHREKITKKVRRTDEEKRTSALARKNGVCYWCKEKKRKCDLHEKSPYQSCRECATKKTYKGVLRMPCFTSTLADMLFFRAGPAVNEPLFITRETVFQLANFSKPDVGVITLKLTQKIGNHHLVVYASQFEPLPGDKLSYTLIDKGTRQKKYEIPMPHFCLTNYEQVHGNILEYINLSKKAYLHTLEDIGGLTWEVVSMAMKYAETRKGSLVDTALDLWVICRMIEDPWELLEDNELGVSRVDLPGTKFHGKIPIPPMMDTQLDQVIIQFVLNHLRGKVIGLFERNISPAKPETWFETFLASFILLMHIERLAAHSARHAETHTMPTKYSNTKFLEQAFNTAKIILSRFHYACNGSVPLGLDWKASHVSSMAKLGPKEVEFMQRIQNAFKERGAFEIAQFLCYFEIRCPLTSPATEQDLRNLPAKHEYEAHGHWYHQLFIENWDTSPVDVKDPYQ